MSSPRNAPRRESVSITKIGKYGHVIWAHQLVCGHTITRKRKSITGVLGCVKCIEATGFEELASALATPVEEPLDDGLSEAEAEAFKVRARKFAINGSLKTHFRFRLISTFKPVFPFGQF